MDYDIVLLFGMTELKAQVAWKENVSLIILSYPILFNLTDFCLVVFFRELRNGEFVFFYKKKKRILVSYIYYIYYRSATKIVYDPDTTNDDP